MKIGFIGLGIMGSRMAANLLAENPQTVIWNRSKDKAEALLKAGAIWAATPEDFAGVDVLFTMLSQPDAVSQAALGDQGFLQHLKPGTIWVDCSTGHPRFAREMHQAAATRQVRFIDAPVAGTKPHAQNKELVFFVGGAEKAVAAVSPLLEMMGKKVVHVGKAGAATSLKVVVNMMLGVAMAGFSEAVSLGLQMGLSEKMLLNVLIGGPVAAPFLGMKREMLERDRYEADFPLQWMHKDMLMAVRAAADQDRRLPLTEVVGELFGQAKDSGLGEQDFAALYAYMKASQHR